MCFWYYWCWPRVFCSYTYPKIDKSTCGQHHHHRVDGADATLGWRTTVNRRERRRRQQQPLKKIRREHGTLPTNMIHSVLGDLVTFIIVVFLFPTHHHHHHSPWPNTDNHRRESSTQHCLARGPAGIGKMRPHLLHHRARQVKLVTGASGFFFYFHSL